MTHARLRLTLFVALLGSVLLLVILFGAGLLRFGISGPVTYGIYVLAGLLSSVTTFGILDSVGEIQGKNFGNDVKLGGAVVALVLVVVGGVAYERIGRDFDVLLRFQRSDGVAAKVSGTLTVYLGAETRNLDLDGATNARVSDVPARFADSPLKLDLSMSTHRIVGNSSQLTPEMAIDVTVAFAETHCPAAEADLKLRNDSQDVMMAGPYPDKLDLTLRLRISPGCDRPVPLAKRARVKLVNVRAGCDELSLELASEEVPPGGASILHVNGLVPKDMYRACYAGRDASLTFFYDQQIGKGERAYTNHVSMPHSL